MKFLAITPYPNFPYNYSIPDVPPGSYTVNALIDQDGDLSPGTGEYAGKSAPFTVVSSAIAAVNVLLEPQTEEMTGSVVSGTISLASQGPEGGMLHVTLANASDDSLVDSFEMNAPTFPFAFTFENVANGDYVVRGRVDEDNDGQLDIDELGGHSDPFVVDGTDVTGIPLSYRRSPVDAVYEIAIGSPVASSTVSGSIVVSGTYAADRVPDTIMLGFDGVDHAAGFSVGVWSVTVDTTTAMDGSEDLLVRYLDSAGNSVATAGESIFVDNIADASYVTKALIPGGGYIDSDGHADYAYWILNWTDDGEEVILSGVNRNTALSEEFATTGTGTLDSGGNLVINGTTSGIGGGGASVSATITGTYDAEGRFRGVLSFMYGPSYAYLPVAGIRAPTTDADTIETYFGTNIDEGDADIVFRYATGVK